MVVHQQYNLLNLQTLVFAAAVVVALAAHQLEACCAVLLCLALCMVHSVAAILLFCCWWVGVMVYVYTVLLLNSAANNNINRPQRALTVWFFVVLSGMYYLRTRAAADAIKFTVDQQALQRNKPVAATAASPAKLMAPVAGNSGATARVADNFMDAERQLAAMVCSLENKDACLACGS